MKTFDEVKAFFIDLIGKVDAELISMSAAFQVGFLLVIVGLSLMASRPLRGLCDAKINRVETMPRRMREIMCSATRLIFFGFVLLGIFIASKILGPYGLNTNTAFLTITGKLLMAWVFIQLFSQFIGHRVVRNIFALGVYAVAALSMNDLTNNTERFVSKFNRG